ncbi:S-layer homology domain-containing protein, partial [Filifactor alocis]|uniref:S-layer homology domain-containing protein n=1 Tax=Filifactor alocis TaxID=143361 RepID=UPI003FA077C8
LSSAPNGVYFFREQKQDKDRPEHEKLFEKADSKVWYVGAGFVKPEDGYVTKHFNVVRTSDGEYVIRDANHDLVGKMMEIVAVDGAGNFAPTIRVVFDDAINAQDNKLHYTLKEYDAETKEFNQIGEGIVGGELKTDTMPNVPEPQNPEQGEEVEELEGAPVVSIEKTASTLGEMKGKRAKGKEFTNIRVLDKSSWTAEEKEKWISTGEDCTIKDESGNPKYYDVVEYDNKYYHTKVLEDGNPILFIWSEAEESGNPEEYARQKGCKLFPIELEEVSTEELEKEGKFKIELNESNGFSVIGSLTNVDKNTKVYFQSKNMRNISKKMKKEISTFAYDKDQHTMKFDFYGNRTDVETNSNPFNYDGGEIYIWAVNDNGERSKRVTLVMPEAKKSDEPTDPLLGSDDYKAYSSMLRNIEELKGNGNGGIAGGDKGQPTILAVPTGKTVRNEDTKEDHAVFALKDKLRIKKGYAVRIVSYNAGKMSLEALSDKVYAIDPSKMTKEDHDFGEEGKNGERFIDINILQGFNALRFEIYKPDVDSQGNFVGVERDSNGEITKIPEENLVFEKGRCVYFDKDPVTFELDPDTFNPYVPANDKPIIYSKTSPMTIRGTIGDKGGFMWQLRMNHHIIDEYLIYGDLKVNNTRDFSFTTDVRDGDVLDIGIKDYSGNTFPEKSFKTLDGETKKQMPSQYKIYVDNKKPEIEIETKDNHNITSPMYTLSTQGESSVLKIQISDKISSGEEGRLQEIFVTVNGQAVTKGDTILEDAKSEKPWKIVVTASDYAKNKTVQKYEYNGNELRKVVPSTRKVIFDLNGGEGKLFDTGNELTINQGEDCFLPYLRTITPPLEKEFDCWEVVTTDSTGAEVKTQRKPGDILYVKEDTKVKALWKDKVEKEKVTITLYPDGNSKIVKTVKMDKGSVYRLPDATNLVKKDRYVFEGWNINEKLYRAGDAITVDQNLTATAVWKAKSGQENPPSGGGGSSSGGNSSSNVKDNNKKDLPKPSEQPVPNTDVSNNLNNNEGSSIDQIVQKYSDISNHWAKNSIALCLQKGYFVGTSNNTFEPNKTLSRAEFVTAFGKFAGNSLE